jgi:uncharacterized protein YbjT (DUF2867 family)
VDGTTICATLPRMSFRHPHPLKSLLLAGASGLIGTELVRQGLALDGLDHLHALVRRLPAGAAADPRLQWHRVDLARPGAVPAAEAAACALGTTIKVAGSQAAFRAVDFDAVLAFARAARAAGVQRFAVVSALGADARSGVFYSRVKGEMEEALRELGFASLTIARPSLLAGNRAALGQPVRLGERLGLALTAPLGGLVPAAWRPIHADVVARALLRALTEGRPGVQVLESAQLQKEGQS